MFSAFPCSFTFSFIINLMTFCLYNQLFKWLFLDYKLLIVNIIIWFLWGPVMEAVRPTVVERIIDSQKCPPANPHTCECVNVLPYRIKRAFKMWVSESMWNGWAQCNLKNSSKRKARRLNLQRGDVRSEAEIK